MTRGADELRRAVLEHADTRTLGPFDLWLYIAGITPRSRRAIARVRAAADEFLPGRYELHVIDLYQQPELARTQQVVAAPTLIRRRPLPLRRLVGDMADEERLLIGLELVPQT